VAALLTELCKHSMYLCNGDWVKSDVFLDGIRNVVGWFKVEISYDKEPVTGQIVLRSRPALSVRPDPAVRATMRTIPSPGVCISLITSGFPARIWSRIPRYG